MNQPSLDRTPDDPAAAPPGSDADSTALPPAGEETPGEMESDTAATHEGGVGDEAPGDGVTDGKPGAAADPVVIVSPERAQIANLKQQLAIRDQALSAKDDQLKSYITAYKQATADMDRERGRLERERERALDQDRMTIVSDLLDVLDNLSRSRQALATGGELDDLASGLDMVQEQFLAALARLGVERIDALGQIFDASVHEATGMVPASGDQGDQEVIHEERVGYLLRGQLLRPSRVIVASRGD